MIINANRGWESTWETKPPRLLGRRRPRGGSKIDILRFNLYIMREKRLFFTAGVGEAVAPFSGEEEGEESPNSTGQDGR